ncbi:MAG: YggS family pyridoxal phosphate-dependent enzyme [Gemmatimonadetes bacterium]|nr:YggS family pyridoxal phosphate-dependent enzyme [Gemmatimonadota bacterium]
MDTAALAENLARVRDDIAGVQVKQGLSHLVRIIAVTKGHGAEVVKEAVHAGLTDVGENRVQEAVAKQAELVGLPVHWHLIGHLQTNKAKLVPGAFTMVHSVDSLRLAEALAGAAHTAHGERLSVLLQVNVAGESQKSGCSPEEAPALVERISALPDLSLEGLMTMAPFTDDARVQRPVFEKLRRLRDKLATPARPLSELSMGMSGDYRAAVAEGSTMVRLGTVLFGERAA